MGKQLFDFKGSFYNAVYLEKVTLESIIVRKKGFTFTVEPSKDGCIISYGSTKFNIPAFVEKTIFLQDEPFSANDIKGLISNQGKLELIKEFIRAGFLSIEQI